MNVLATPARTMADVWTTTNVTSVFAVPASQDTDVKEVSV